VPQGLKASIRKVATTLLTEGLDPASAAAAVFWGVFIGIVPIYGLQTLAALALAFLLRLNKPLTLAATFVNNPLLLPPTVAAAVELGAFARHGSLLPWRQLIGLSTAQVKEQLFSWVLGSLLLGLLAGGAAAIVTAAVVYWIAPAQRGLRARIRFVNRTFAGCAQFDRGFVRWKMRLDRIFSLLAAEDLGSGTVVDLGCGYGMALAFAAFGERGRRLAGCDLNAHRIAVAEEALRGFHAEASIKDVREFALPPAGLILILDVLQYLSPEEQLALLKRCCKALEPGGRLIFRVHDRERGLWTALTLGLDRLIFSSERVGVRPTILEAAQYRTALQEAGMAVEERRFRNRLPLAHILFLARRPAAESAL
jgi:uncharacterized protein (DUF2062 family)/2-polyprenyl-3-methyl-5-hydroxy-6-metoxy-1,4-benzoquinol methylase